MSINSHFLLSVICLVSFSDSFAEELLFLQNSGGSTHVSSWDTSTGAVTQLHSLGSISIPQGTQVWDPTLGKLYVPTSAGTIIIYDRETNTSAVETNPSGSLAFFPNVKSGGTNALISSDDSTSAIHVDDINSTLKLQDGAISDSSGDNIISKSSDGAVHIGTNSLVTIEENGRQSLYATDASGSSINIDVNNGSDLLVNGTSVMGSIRGLGEGLKANTALTAALTSVPTMSNGREFECGLGLGGYDNKSALATSCGWNINESVNMNVGVSHLLSGSETYLVDNLPSYVVRAGFSFKFGAKKSTLAFRKQNMNTENHALQDELQLEKRKVAQVTHRVSELEEEAKELRREVAEMKLLMSKYSEMIVAVTDRSISN